jgi:uncharacterized protein YcbK (DUF882 family)
MALAAAISFAPNATESVVANGDTRTLSFSDSHTNESGQFTYMVNGVYDSATLDKLNWYMRDWRLNEPTKMDPHLFDIIWEVYRESGSTQPIDVLSGYRSPSTNAMLRRRSRQVAEHSEHMLGKAIDAHFLDVGTARIRDIAMRMQAGGVGFYPTGNTPWVHIDSGSVRYWPRMSRDAMTRLFPDGKTVFIPADGKPMPGFEEARAAIEARGGEVQTASAGSPFGFLAFLFGGGADDAEEGAGQAIAMGPRDGRAGAGGRAGGGGPATTFETASAGPQPTIAAAKQNLPKGETFASAADAPAAASAPQQPQAVGDAEALAAAGDASPIKLSGPIAALYLAPLPPKRPADLEATQVAAIEAPLPPTRPAEMAFAAPSPPSRPATEASAGAADTVVAMLENNNLPSAITRGLKPIPSHALALAEEPGRTGLDDQALLDRAVALYATLPPLADDDATGSTMPAHRRSVVARGRAPAAALAGREAIAFGDLSYDAFRTPPPTLLLSPLVLGELRGSAP